MTARLRLTLLLVGLISVTLATAACGNGEDRVVVTASEAAFVPVVESSDVFVGVPRLVLTLLEQDGQPEFEDGAQFQIRYFEPTEGGVKFHSEAELQTANVEGFQYFIATEVPFSSPGTWAIAVTVELADGRAESTPRLAFLVDDHARGPQPGDPAPTARTPTATDSVLERMLQPADSALAMYERPASALIAAGEPFLIVWASAERCAGRRACARALEQAQDIHNRGKITVLHVEPFGRPRPAELQALIDTANEAWSVEAEPQLYVVDADGRIAARFEIVVETSELEAAIGAVLR